MEKQITELNGKLQALNFRIGKTAEAIEKRERDAAERCCESLHKAINAVSDLRETIEDKKFGKGDSAEDVNDWASKLNIDDTLNRADQCSKQLKTLIAEIVREAKQADELHDHQHALELEQEKLQMQHEATAKAHAEQLEFERKRLELQQHEGLSTSQHGIASGDSAVKMPKLVISQFDGTHRDWMRFWGQFETQIDKSGVPGVTKFSYLKELVDPKVRNLIGGLPFTDEGYSKAKELLCRKFGNTSEIVGSYVRNILELPNIKERNVEGIHEFYETLLFNVESLRTMGELKKLDAAVRFTFDKLQVIKMELTMVNENWAEWDFDQFLSVLEKWSINNPVLKTKYSQREKGKAFWSNEEGKRETGNWPRASGCFYCESNQHKAVNCDKVKSNDERKKILSTKRLCYNCMGARHRASDCKSKNTCRTCNGKHHTSICDKDQNPPRESGMTANLVGDNGAVVHPVVVVRIDGYKFRALLDSGASHSYISSTGIDLIKAKPHSTGLRQIAMLTETTTRTMQTFNVLIESVSSDFQLEVNVTKVEKRELLILGNPGYPKLLERHSHLRGVVMDDVDEKDNLPVHIILGANDFAKIRTSEKLRVGRRGDPVAEFTRFGWTIMSPGASAGSTNAFLTLNSATSDYEQLCALDVLGLAEQSGSQAEVYDEFKETLKRSPEGWYEVALPWKGNCPELLDNYSGSLQRLNSLLRKLRRTDMLEEYDAVIREQLENGVVERVPAGEEGKRFYLPHRAVLRDSSSSTRLRVVYDASARAQDQAPSLNECLHTGPPLNNQLWSVMIRQRFHPVAVAGDLRKAFLQIRVREADRDVLRFHWIRDKNSRDVEALRFTRVLFGLGPSPFLLNGVLQQHLENLSETYPETVREIRDSLYVDDLISGAPTTSQARQLKREAVEIFEDGKFTLHKWNSNVRELETDGIVTDLGEQSFAKEQFNAVQGESKLLGLGWNKAEDKLLVNFPSIPAVTTRRGILASLAKVYDPLGLVSPVILEAKQLYRDACVKKLAWDAPLPQSQGMSENKFTVDKEQLNLQLNGEGVWVCHGRIQGELPIYLPDSSPVTAEMVKRAHETSIHGGVSLTMAKVREKFWVPRLRRLAKRIVKYCWGCKRFHAVSAGDPPPGYLPRERTEGTVPFDVIGVDFAGPIKYRNKKKEEKAHVVLYSCCQTRGVFLEVLPSLETPEFLQSLKRLIARRGRPSRIYSDNGSTFKAAAKWLRKVKEDERFHEFLSDRSITWNFNVSRAPWWGGHFERLIGVMKAAFYKSVGQGLLSWSELCELILDIEISMNNRPLCYLEEDAQLPTLTPNSFLFLNTNYLPELEPHSVDDRDLRKRARFLKTTKEAMWRRWTGEYLRALRERHQLKNRGKENQLAVGDVVIIKSDDRNRNNWPLGIVEELYVGRDDIVRAAKLRAGRGHMERAIKHLYRLELSCDLPRNQPSVLNPEAVAYRPRRDAAAAAGLRVRDILDDDDH